VPLQKQKVSWPLTGGLDTKTAPLAVQAGSFLQLDNVRQERIHEWKARYGFSVDTNDNGRADSVYTRAVELPGGSVLAQGVGNGVSADTLGIYIPSQASNKWVNKSTNNWGLNNSPKVWSRKTLSSFTDQPDGVAFATSGTIDIVAWWKAGKAPQLSRVNRATGAIANEANLTFGSSTAIFVRAVYHTTSTLLCVFYADTASEPAGTSALYAATFNGTTGAAVTASTKIAAGFDDVGAFIDARVYGSSDQVTVVGRTSADTIRFLEVTPATLALATDVTLATACTTTLSLMTDPDASGIRLIGASDSVAPATKVIRVNSAGAIQTNDTVSTQVATQITGSAHTAGAGWNVVYSVGGLIRQVDKIGGVVGAVSTYKGHADNPLVLLSCAWRTAGDPGMHFLVACTGSDATLDPQRSYFELRNFYGADVLNAGYFPQARLIPLEGGTPLASGALAQVQQVSTQVYATALHRTSRYSLASGAPAYQVGIDRWSVTYLTPANLPNVNTGQGLTTASTAYLPDGALLQTCNGDLVCNHGAEMIPNRPTTLTPATGTGALTVTAEYQYLTTDELMDDGGNVWRSPPGISRTVALTGTENEVAFVGHVSGLENQSRVRTIKVWRTKGNGSVFQLLYQTTVNGLTTSVSFTDRTSDDTLAASEFLPAGLPASITPAFSHIAQFGNRLWGVSRDFPNRLHFSHPLLSGFSPEFPAEFVMEIDDSEGEPTGMAAMDDRLILFKSSAVYVITGDGPDANGGGSFPFARLVSSEVGCTGGHAVSTGDEVYFAGSRGVFRINRSEQIEYVGAQIERYFLQPLIATAESVAGMVFSPSENEIRVQTTNYRFVFNRDLQLWSRDTGGMGSVVITRMIGGVQWLWKSNNQVWKESTSATSDAGTAYQGLIRAPWIRAAGVDGSFRLYRIRAIGERTSGGASVTPTMTVYFNNDDTISETKTSPAISGATTVIRAEVRPSRGPISAFSPQLTLPAGDQTIRLDHWAAEVGIRPAMQKLAATTRWA
jgi:hypothetical protein